MAAVFPMDRDVTFTATDNGSIAVLGQAALNDSTGGWMVTLVCDGTCDLQLAVLGRPHQWLNGARVTPAESQKAPFVPVPYRRVSINNVASDYALVSDVVSGTTMIVVPANGIDVGLLLSITQGTARIYSAPVTGSTAP